MSQLLLDCEMSNSFLHIVEQNICVDDLGLKSFLHPLHFENLTMFVFLCLDKFYHIHVHCTLLINIFEAIRVGWLLKIVMNKLCTNLHGSGIRLLKNIM